MEIPVGYGQVNYFFVGAAVPRGAQIVIGIDNDTALTASQVATAAAAAFVDNLIPLLPEVVTLEKVKCKLGPNDTGAEATVSIGEPGGLAATEPMPPNVSILTKKVTDQGGRKNAGKINVPAFPEADSDGGGLLTTVALAAWQAAMTAFRGDLETADIDMVVLHTDDADTPTPVLSLEVQQKLATQKRRLRRAGGRRTPTP